MGLYSSKPSAAGLLLWARRAEDVDRLLHDRRSAAAAGMQCILVNVYSRSAGHRFVYFI